jgi:HD-GYP domain-containing protein (c-di-GMP phosphodiesterase class II)
LPPRETQAEILAIAANGRPQISLKNTNRYRLVLPIQEVDGPALVAISDLPVLARSFQDSRLEQARLQKWLQLVQSRLSFGGWPLSQYRNDNPYHEELKTLLTASRELNDLLGSVRIPGDSSEYPNRILQRIAAVLAVETLIWVPHHGVETLVIEGDHLLSAQDCSELARLLSRSPHWDPSGYLILNDRQCCGLGARFRGITNLIALSVGEKDAGGCLIALNKSDAAAAVIRSPAIDGCTAHAALPDTSPGRPITNRRESVPFRRIDAAALMPFGSFLGLQSRFSRHQSHVQELFAGLIRSLTAAIDAKDSYTCGHSERVARVAVELGRELELSELELGDVYLAGLLHDIGKIGIPDSVLCKCGPLTAEESMQVRQHVLIGCRILEEFREISHLLPLVLSHHERYDGMGYPHGLSGEAIPLLARVLAVADGYDAMNTSRPYRAALVRDRIEDSLEQGSNRQWDGKVVDAFFRARERIYGIHQRAVGDSAWFALDTFGERRSPGPMSPLFRQMSS